MEILRNKNELNIQMNHFPVQQKPYDLGEQITVPMKFSQQGPKNYLGRGQLTFLSSFFIKK